MENINDDNSSHSNAKTTWKTASPKGERNGKTSWYYNKHGKQMLENNLNSMKL